MSVAGLVAGSLPGGFEKGTECQADLCFVHCRAVLKEAGRLADGLPGFYGFVIRVF